MTSKRFENLLDTFKESVEFSYKDKRVCFEFYFNDSIMSYEYVVADFTDKEVLTKFIQGVHDAYDDIYDISDDDKICMQDMIYEAKELLKKVA